MRMRGTAPNRKSLEMTGIAPSGISVSALLERAAYPDLSMDRCGHAFTEESNFFADQFYVGGKAHPTPTDSDWQQPSSQVKSTHSVWPSFIHLAIGFIH
jgi:hypothetical protein